VYVVQKLENVILLTIRYDADSKSDLRGYSTALAMVSFDRPHTISYYTSIATMSLFCIVSDILSHISRNLKRSQDLEHILFHGNLSFVH